MPLARLADETRPGRWQRQLEGNARSDLVRGWRGERPGHFSVLKRPRLWHSHRCSVSVYDSDKGAAMVKLISL